MARRVPRRLGSLPRIGVGGAEFPVAEGLLARGLGLAFLDRDAAGPGLLIPRCRSVHTFGMRFCLDLVFLDRELRVVGERRSVTPRRFAGCRRADSVLELPAGGEEALPGD